MDNTTSITTDMINRRLGGGRNTYREPEPEAVEDIQSATPGLSAGFIVMILVLFLAVGGGTYLFAGSDYTWYEFKQAISKLAQSVR